MLAARLSEDPGVTVLLLEYGGPDRNPLLHVPKGFYFTLRGGRYTYRYATQPIGPGGQHETWIRGKVLGGSTAVNGMMWTRGAEADFAALEARGNPGWGWDQVLPVYRAMEDHNLGASAMRGAGGPLGVSVLGNADEVVQAVLASAQGFGWDHVDDTNAYDTERIGFTPSTIRNGRRTTAYGTFVRPARSRPNLVVRTRTRAGHLLFDGRRVVGIRVRHGARTEDVTARREVVLAAGTVETPLLLERSGIGRPDVLHGLGIDLRVDSPHVGERILEQRAVTMQVRLNADVGPTQELNTRLKQGREGVKYLLTHRGPIATAGYDLVCQFKSSPELARPDIHGLFVPFALDTASEEMKLARHSGVMFMGYPIRPRTFSSVHATGPMPEDPPVIDARFLDDPTDRSATAPVLDIARRVLGQGPIAGYVADEEFPGPSVATGEDTVRWALDAGSGIYHGVGSAAMGPDDDDVVDPRLRVRGVDGLRIADASVLPIQVAGNTAAPAMAVGWRAADLIAEDR